jgi:hypothetical protein
VNRCNHCGAPLEPVCSYCGVRHVRVVKHEIPMGRLVHRPYATRVNPSGFTAQLGFEVTENPC